MFKTIFIFRECDDSDSIVHNLLVFYSARRHQNCPSMFHHWKPLSFDQSYDLPLMKLENKTIKLKDNLVVVININFI